MVQELMSQTAVEMGAEVVVISEPWKTLPTWHIDPLGKAAVWVTERGARAVKKIRAVGCKDGAVAVELDDTYVVSCYYSPNIPFCTYEERLDELQELLMECDLDRTLVMGDFNAKSPAWGSTRSDKRGLAALELAGSCGLVPLISEGEYSFERNGRYSLIDIALSGRLTLAQWRGSKILDFDSASDHFYLTHEFGATTTQVNETDYRANKRIDLNRLKKEYDRASELASPMLVATRDDIDAYVELIGDLVGASFVNDHPTIIHKRPVWWWSEEIATARKLVVAARRRLQRARTTRRTTAVEIRLAAYKALRGDLKRLIIKAKRVAWGKMIDGVGADVWGKPYRWVLGSINRKPPLTKIGRNDLDEVIKNLFVTVPEEDNRPGSTMVVGSSGSNEDVVATLNCEKVRAAIKKVKKKATGPDGITCLELGYFPRAWKRGRLVLIPKKPGPDGKQAWRPLCILSNLAKVFEYCVKAELTPRVTFAKNQYGFVGADAQWMP
ncbi:uncharacterized protein LOC144477508 [Augochlora pura]